MSIKVTIFNEFHHEQHDEAVKKIYPNGMHNTIKDFLSENPDFEVTTATLEEPEHGLTDEVLKNTDVLIWWGHIRHHLVSDEVVQKVRRRVLQGMGFIPLHSSHMSKPFLSLMGTSGRLYWCEAPDISEILWTVVPSHPIVKDVPEYFKLDIEEMYGEPFGIPTPDEVVFISWFSRGNVFRSGCTFKRGNGKIFYFRPGHETSPTFHNKNIQKVISNAIYWANPDFPVKPMRDMYFPKDLRKED